MALDLSAVGKELPPSTYEYGDREVILYALGVGATTQELDFVYEKNLKVLPTFAVIPAFPALMGLGRVLEFNPAMLLHGEQRIELRGAIPTSGKLTTQGKVSAIYDKGSGALVVVDAETKDESGNVLFTNTFGAFIRGITVEYKTSPDQAALYRLSGDRNPLHIDPDFAKLAGFDRPILHGLCTFGHVGRAILHSVCGSDPARLKAFEVRFSGIVFPGETIVTEIWKESDTRVIVQARTAERGEPVISNAAATIVP
jgi:acyl dehydratase